MLILFIALPAFALELTVSPPTAPVQKGAPFTVQYSATQVPSNASIGFFLEKEKENSPGPSGALALKSTVLQSGNGSFTWDGKSFGCAPTDYPTICPEVVEPGRYFIRADAFDKPDAWLIGLNRQASPGDPKVIASARSSAFTVEGPVDLGNLRMRLRLRALQLLETTFDLYSYSGTQIEKYIKPDSVITAAGTTGNFCQSFSYLSPFAGTVRACGPNSTDPSQITITGTARVAEGQVSYSRASQAALAEAAKPYLKRVRYRRQEDIPAGLDSAKDPEATTYLGDGVQNWAFREGYWVFELHEGKAGGSEKRKDAFDDTVYVRVSASGRACVVKTVRGRGMDIFKDKFECAK